VVVNFDEKKCIGYKITTILYDNRFHRNYREFGCKNGNYLGDPLAALYVPVK
jgi:hypothetical protein